MAIVATGHHVVAQMWKTCGTWLFTGCNMILRLSIMHFTSMVFA